MHSIGLVATQVSVPTIKTIKTLKCKVNFNLTERLDWARWVV